MLRTLGCGDVTRLARSSRWMQMDHDEGMTLDNLMILTFYLIFCIQTFDEYQKYTTMICNAKEKWLTRICSVIQ